MLKFRASDLKELATAIFEHLGTPASAARCVAESLVEANLAGHASHGVIRIKEYALAVKEGRIAPGAEPTVISESGRSLKVDGGGGFGQVVANWTIERLLSKADEYEMASGGIANCGHVGRLGPYVQRAAEEGFVALAFVNGGANQPRLAPFGGAQPVFGTNPLAAGIPGGKHGPIVMDFSTAAIAAGKIRVARDSGELLPAGCILDREGNPSRNPEDYYGGGMLLPSAGHKGYGLAVLVEVMAGLLSGAGSPILSGWKTATTNGVFFWLLKVGAFRPLEEFRQDMTRLGEVIKETRPMDGVTEVLLPGEPEQRMRTAVSEKGIELPNATWQAIVDLVESFDLSGVLPKPIQAN